jgi:hypothetical protein
VRLQFRQENLLNEFAFLWRASREHPVATRDESFIVEMTAFYSNGRVDFRQDEAKNESFGAL